LGLVSFVSCTSPDDADLLHPQDGSWEGEDIWFAVRDGGTKVSIYLVQYGSCSVPGCTEDMEFRSEGTEEVDIAHYTGTASFPEIQGCTGTFSSKTEASGTCARRSPECGCIAAMTWEAEYSPPLQLPEIEVTPNVLDFGSLIVDTESTMEASVSSVGEIDLEVLEVVLEGSDAFSLPDQVTTFSLAPGENQSLTVQFTAPAGAAAEGALHIHSNAVFDTVVEIQLHGTGLAQSIAIDPSFWDFGEVEVGCEAITEVTISNEGAYPLTIEDFTYYAAPSTTAMTLRDGGLEEGLQLEPGGSVQAEVVFAPDDIQDYEGLLTVHSDDPNQPEKESTQSGQGVAAGWHEDSFGQVSMGSDILFVVDNTTTMSEEQEQLGAHFPDMLTVLEATGLEYRIAVITTDDPEFQGTPTVLDATTPDVAAEFAEACSVGTDGNEVEQGLMMGSEALDMANAQLPPNDGFLRQDALLHAVFVSDEADQSGSWATHLANLQALKLNPDHVRLSAICGTDGQIAAGCSGSGGSADPGTGYVDVALASGGILASICEEDWSATTELLGWASFGLHDTFTLTHDQVIPSTIEVKNNGVTLSQGWAFEASINAIVFEPSYVPAVGDLIEIYYAYGSCS